MNIALRITINHDGAGLLDEFGPDSEWAYWFDNEQDDEAYGNFPHASE
jgi:hypothetical protein